MQPDLGEQMFGLSPRSKVQGGFLLAGAGVALTIWMWERNLIAGLVLFAALLGVAVCLTGLRELARERAIDAEVARAKSEWQELETGVRMAKANGTGVARYLQAKGYREYAVRRWIAQELDPGRTS